MALRLAGRLRLQAIAGGVGDLAHGLGLAFRLQDARLAQPFGLQDPRLPQPFGFQDLCALLAFRLHLAVHGGGHVCRRIDALDLDAHDAGAPLVGRLVQYRPQLHVDHLARGERLVQLRFADDVAQVRLRQLGGSRVEVGHVVGQLHRVGGFVVDDGVHRHHHVVLGDDLLRLHVDDLLAHVDLAHAVYERDDEVEAGLGRVGIAPQPLDDTLLVRRDDAKAEAGDERGGEDDENEDQAHC